ncbi:hypothetical protein HGRIS_005325 [Hohenbuehelia grisea]|uniref:Fe2OG dioxygenase domain-containing protein n=1 Tax=Hohenbuehelia grisea TaxID=104357 RepID=A0ABR3JFJ6_9AGAR
MSRSTEHPPFPDDIPTHPLIVVDYARIVAGDEAEVDKLWDAATNLGFWYLKNHGVEVEANGMFDMGEATMALPLEEKMKYEQGDDGNSFGYKARGAIATGASGARDIIEFINIGADDAHAYPDVVHRTYPPVVQNDFMGRVAQPFVRKSTEVNNVLLRAFERRLGLPDGALAKRHDVRENSGSEARVTYVKASARGEGNTQDAPTQEKEKETLAIGAHTDFGSLSFLHNRLGGLQVLPPGTDQWFYVRPIPGHAICNLGDAMAIFSGGILRSNIHRVLPPPGAQRNFDRWSLVFFTRPGDSVVLKALADESPLIARAVETAQRKESGSTSPGNNTATNLVNTGETAGEWFKRRIMNQRINNRKGPETWAASRGTEIRV